MEKNKMKGDTIEVTTVLFVPPTPNGKLTRMMEEVEQNIRLETGWGSKIVEKPGIPLALQFLRKTPMINGCPLGDLCILCENKGTKCTVRSVVYKASYLACETEKLECSDEITADRLSQGVYIGETSRPIRSRIREHLENLKK